MTLRFGIGGLGLVALFHRRLRHITRQELRAGLLIGIFLFAAYALQTCGLQYTTSSRAAFLTGLYVPFVTILSSMLLRQRSGLMAIIGLVLSFVGLTLLSVNEHFSLAFNLGDLLVIGCALASALHIVSISRFAPKMDPVNLSVIQIGLTALLSLLSIPLNHEAIDWPSLPVWGSALFMGLIATSFCLLLMNWVQRFVSSTQATLLYALEPAWAGVFGYFAGELFTRQSAFGCALIFLGMIVGVVRLPRGKRTRLSEEMPIRPLEEAEL